MRLVPDNSVFPQSRSQWRAWLSEQHAHSSGVWLITNKKASGKFQLRYDEAVEEALCFGWVDSKPGKLDAERTMLWFTPRRPGSGWSAPNKERVERLLAAGLMEQAGLAKVDAAKADGSWSLLDTVEQLQVPEDLASALSGLARATEYFQAFPRSTRRGILEWVQSAKRPETRAKRIAEVARLAAVNQRANQWPKVSAIAE